MKLGTKGKLEFATWLGNRAKTVRKNISTKRKHEKQPGNDCHKPSLICQLQGMAKYLEPNGGIDIGIGV